MKAKLAVSFLIPVITISVLSCSSSTAPSRQGTWKIAGQINSSSSINSIRFINEKTGWAAGSQGKIFKTEDGGINWSQQYSGINSKLLNINFINEYSGWITGLNNVILYTSNGGASWALQSFDADSTKIISAIAYCDDFNCWAINNAGRLYFSSDRGETWQTKTCFNEYGFSNIFFPCTMEGFIFKHFGNLIYRTFDGGDTWQRYDLPVAWSSEAFFVDQNSGWVAEDWAVSSTIHESAAVYFTSDGGLNWEKRGSIKSIMLDNLIFVNGNSGWCNSADKIYRTTDGGFTWNVEFTLEDNQFIKDLFLIDEMNGWALTSNNYIVKYSPM